MKPSAIRYSRQTFEQGYPYKATNILKSIFAQGCTEMRLWPNSSCTSPMNIHKITPSVDYVKWLKRLNIV